MTFRHSRPATFVEIMDPVVSEVHWHGSSMAGALNYLADLWEIPRGWTVIEHPGHEEWSSDDPTPVHISNQPPIYHDLDGRIVR